MATYKEIQGYVKDKYGIIIKTCWIAHTKEICEIDVKIANNRNDRESRRYPCPEDKQFMIKEAFKHFNML